MNIQLEEDFKCIMDVFTGADGGVDFIKLKESISALDNQSAHGDENADRLLNIVHQFARLTRLLTKGN